MAAKVAMDQSLLQATEKLLGVGREVQFASKFLTPKIETYTVILFSDFYIKGCSYPHMTIPGTGRTDGITANCKNPSLCPKRTEGYCDDRYMVWDGTSCNIYCKNNRIGTETWTCADGKWVLTSEPLECENGNVNNFFHHISQTCYKM